MCAVSLLTMISIMNVCLNSLVMISYLKGVGPVLSGDVITAGLGDLVTVKFPVVA